MRARSCTAAAAVVICVLASQTQFHCQAAPFEVTDTPRRSLLKADSVSTSQTYLLAYREEHAGSPLPGHEDFIIAAGGHVVTAHPEIAVVVARSASKQFAAKLKASDSRVVVRAKICCSCVAHAQPVGVTYQCVVLVPVPETVLRFLPHTACARTAQPS